MRRRNASHTKRGPGRRHAQGKPRQTLQPIRRGHPAWGIVPHAMLEAMTRHPGMPGPDAIGPDGSIWDVKIALRIPARPLTAPDPINDFASLLDSWRPNWRT